MHTLDTLIQNHFPATVVPKYGELPDHGTGKSRLLLAKEGLFIDTRQPFGKVRKLLWKSPRALPYGSLVEYNCLEHLFSHYINPLVIYTAAAEAQFEARNNREWVGWILFEDGVVRYERAPYSATSRKVDYLRPDLAPTQHIIADIHSHHTMPPFFSDDDDKDDSGGVRISIVLGNFDGRGFSFIYRYVVEGFFFYPESAAGNYHAIF